MASSSKGNLPKPYKKRRYYTQKEVVEHRWHSYFSKVYDLAPLLEDYKKDPLSQPILAASGTDITHWFDPETRDPRTHTSPFTNLKEVYCPQGRYLHVPPEVPEPGFDTRIKSPWWRDAKYCIGTLTAKTRKIYVMNLLSKQSVLMEVPSEETLGEIEERYLEVHNFHAQSYTWKMLGRPLELGKTLVENGIVDQDLEFLDLGMDPDDHIVTLHIYFNDDLTEG
ncbi:unnamed protein product [Amoebophrya sp. A25]|nr:unnamed protein product [Amoebophrya sp. A25]|eukprot:GSA25T00019617001.1